MITIKNSEEIEIMIEAGKILSGIMRELRKRVRPGIMTEELDRLAESLISCPPKPWRRWIKSEIKPSFKGYEGFPAALCVSINEQIVHGLPDSRIIKEGDLVSLDSGILYRGFHTDMAITLPVGKVSEQAKKLINVTRESLEVAKKLVKPGARLGDISQAIQQYVESQGFNVVRELCGHGIGRELHEEPQILNFVGNDYGGDEEVILKEGMTICIEPMVTAGDWRLKKSKGGYGYETKDGSLSCHFEQTVVVAKNGCQVLTNY